MSASLEPPAADRHHAPELPVDVVRSGRRRKTVQARLVDGRLRLLIPAHLSAADEQHWIEEMRRRFTRKQASATIDLPRRARRLARALDLPEPAGIRWVSNQATRWGSCTPATRQIRLSDRLSGFPAWVIDYVIVHELAHLLEPSHGARFRALEHRYERAERAIGYLLAAGLDPHEHADGAPDGRAHDAADTADGAHRPAAGAALAGRAAQPSPPAPAATRARPRRRPRQRPPHPGATPLPFPS